MIAWQAKAGLTPEFLRDLQELRRVVEPAAVRLVAERATPADIEGVSAAYDGMKKAIEEGGDYVTHDMHFHTGMLVASHNRMIVQMSKALGALLRTSFEISTTRKDAPKAALPLHKAVLDAVIAKNPDKAEKAIRVLIEGAHQDMEHVLTTRRKLPSLAGPAKQIKAPGGALHIHFAHDTFHQSRFVHRHRWQSPLQRRNLAHGRGQPAKSTD